MEIMVLSKEEFASIHSKLDKILSELETLNKHGLSQLKGKWLDGADVLELLHVSTRTLQNWRDNGLIKFSKIGAKIYYRADDVESFLMENME